ncbi:MAG TPA: hypothetical protein VGK67_40405 [Myxococcales bacterium]
MLLESAAGEVRSTINIGRYLFSQLFRASREAFRSKDSNKADSLNDLAAQPGMADAAWSRSRLHNSIELSLMAKVHNDFRAWRLLRVSHYEEVIGLPAERQRELLERAEKERWSVARLKQEAGRQRAPHPVAGPGAVAPEKAPTRLRKLLDQIAPLTDPATVVDSFLVPSGIDAKAAAEFTATMENGLSLLQGFQKQLEEMKQRSANKLKRLAGKVAGPK